MNFSGKLVAIFLTYPVTGMKNAFILAGRQRGFLLAGMVLPPFRAPPLEEGRRI
jgi:hypothetical protein